MTSAPTGPRAEAIFETLVALRRELHALADPVRAAGAGRFFKNGPGQYGAGDQFLGVTVPQVRALVRRTDRLDEAEVLTLLRSEAHEERLLALLILVRRFEAARRDQPTRKKWIELYLANTRWVNNWDLVDSSAPQLLGAWLGDRDRNILKKLAASKCLWEQRIAVLATLAFIRRGEFSDTLSLCESLLSHPHDLMHKACGWMLREVGKRDVILLRSFLDQHVRRMPRTMLRYAVEKFHEPLRQHYLTSPRLVSPALTQAPRNRNRGRPIQSGRGVGETRLTSIV